jgi:hypothetical protein
MKKLLLIIPAILCYVHSFGQYTTCAAAAAGTPLASGSCLTNQNAATAVAAANCGGGFNAGVGFYYPFVAGSCPQFTLTFNAAEEVQFILWNTSCTNLAIECSEATANVPIYESFSATSTPALTSGTTYVLEIVTKTTSNFSICYQANQAEAANNECSGASGISASGATFNNGGNCTYSGSANDGTTSDPPAASFCAGSLENTLWTKFQPVAGATSIQIIGSGIACGGPVCAWQFGLFSGSCAGLTPEGCISNGTACATGPDPNSSSTAPSGGNGTYLLTWNSISATGFTGTITMAGGAPFTGSEVFYLVMDGNANSDCQYTLSGTNIQPLPIELISFEAQIYDNANMLLWEVASQTNNDYFTLERSTDGTNWDQVVTIDGDGTMNTQKKFGYVDDRRLKTLNYYRLKQTDFDGNYQYSGIIAVDNNEHNTTVIKRVNLMGQEVNENYDGVIIELYSNGTTRKVQKN